MQNNQNLQNQILELLSDCKPSNEIQEVKWKQLKKYIIDAENYDLILGKEAIILAINNFKQVCSQQPPQTQQKNNTNQDTNPQKTEQKDQQSQEILKAQLTQQIEFNKAEIDSLEDQKKAIEEELQSIKNSENSNNFQYLDYVVDSYQEKSQETFKNLEENYNYFENIPDFFEKKNGLVDQISKFLQNDEETELNYEEIREFLRSNSQLLIVVLANLIQTNTQLIKEFQHSLQNSDQDYEHNQDLKVSIKNQYLYEIQKDHLHSFQKNQEKMEKIAQMQEKLTNMEKRVQKKFKDQETLIYDNMNNFFKKDLKLIQKQVQLQELQQYNQQFLSNLQKYLIKTPQFSLFFNLFSSIKRLEYTPQDQHQQQQEGTSKISQDELIKQVEVIMHHNSQLMKQVQLQKVENTNFICDSTISMIKKTNSLQQQIYNSIINYLDLHNNNSESQFLKNQKENNGILEEENENNLVFLQELAQRKLIFQQFQSENNSQLDKLLDPRDSSSFLSKQKEQQHINQQKQYQFREIQNIIAELQEKYNIQSDLLENFKQISLYYQQNPGSKLCENIKFKDGSDFPSLLAQYTEDLETNQ